MSDSLGNFCLIHRRVEFQEFLLKSHFLLHSFPSNHIQSMIFFFVFDALDQKQSFNLFFFCFLKNCMTEWGKDAKKELVGINIIEIL